MGRALWGELAAGPDVELIDEPAAVLDVEALSVRAHHDRARAAGGRLHAGGGLRRQLAARPDAELVDRATDVAGHVDVLSVRAHRNLSRGELADVGPRGHLGHE